MSGNKPPPKPTALVRRRRPNPSDADVAALLYRRNHLLGRPRVQALYDPEGGPHKLRLYNPKDVDPEGSYLIYSEADQCFIGFVRNGAVSMKEPGNGDRARLVFFPAAQA